MKNYQFIIIAIIGLGLIGVIAMASRPKEKKPCTCSGEHPETE